MNLIWFGVIEISLLNPDTQGTPDRAKQMKNLMHPDYYHNRGTPSMENLWKKMLILMLNDFGAPRAVIA